MEDEDSIDTPVLDLLARMTADSFEATNLDDQSVMIARIAALVASDAPPASYLLNLGIAGEVGLDLDIVRDILAAIAPIVGTSRTVSALGSMAAAFDLALDAIEFEIEEELDEEE
jgi:hypothetical protein